MFATPISLFLLASSCPALAGVSFLRGEAAQRHAHGAKVNGSEITTGESLVVLHIGKTGGSYVRDALAGAVTESVHILDHKGSHRWMSVCQQYPKLKFALFVRAPVHRFISGWLSRYTRGAPDYHVRWKSQERKAFRRFKSPDQLACALHSPNQLERKKAQTSISAIQHTSWDLKFYLEGIENVRQCKDQIVFVGRTEHLDADYHRFVHFLRHKGYLAREPIVQDSQEYLNISQRVQDRSLDRFRMLSRCSVKGLLEWYQEDYEIINLFVKSGLLDKNYLQEILSLDAAPLGDQKLPY